MPAANKAPTENFDEKSKLVLRDSELNVKKSIEKK